MLAVIMLSAALLILAAAGAALIFTKEGRKKPYKTAKEKELPEFETRYDEIKYLYEKGRISDEEYRRQMKHIIN